VTLSDRGWKPDPRRVSGHTGLPPAVRVPRRPRAVTPARLVLLVAVLTVAYLLVPRHVTIGGRHLHPGFAPYLAPYLFG
jgi:hypothetical protein